MDDIAGCGIRRGWRRPVHAYGRYRATWLTAALTLVLLAFPFVAVEAQVQMRVAPDGTVKFSDRPGPDARPVQVRPVQTVRMPASEPQAAQPASAPPTESAFRYSQVTIVSPKEGEAVRANNGVVAVRMALQPALQPAHAIVLTLDGSRMMFGAPEDLLMTDVSRGLHRLEAEIVDARGESVTRAEPVDFDVLRTSASR